MTRITEVGSLNPIGRAPTPPPAAPRPPATAAGATDATKLVFSPPVALTYGPDGTSTAPSQHAELHRLVRGVLREQASDADPTWSPQAAADQITRFAADVMGDDPSRATEVERWLTTSFADADEELQLGDAAKETIELTFAGFRRLVDQLTQQALGPIPPEPD